MAEDMSASRQNTFDVGLGANDTFGQTGSSAMTFIAFQQGLTSRVRIRRMTSSKSIKITKRPSFLSNSVRELIYVRG